MAENVDPIVNDDSTKKATAAGEVNIPKSLPRWNSRAFRQELLKRLPQLRASKWEPAETLNVYQDMQGVADLDADAFLQPLEPIAEERK